MYFTEVDDQLYGIKPMNCLSHMMIYKSKVRSYRDLPLRYFELGTVHRHEKSGVLHGLMRVRQFTQDDAHIFCRPDQLIAEITAIADIVKFAMAIFGFEYEVELSTRPEKSIGSDKDWEMATAPSRSPSRATGWSTTSTRATGPSMARRSTSSSRTRSNESGSAPRSSATSRCRSASICTISAADGEKHRPVMLHRVILGSIERFIGVLIEHYAGAFPVWLAPVQAVLVTVTDNQVPYGEEVYRKLLDVGVRVERDFKNEKLGYKIREAQLQKIPYMLVIGDKEVASGTISPRQRDGKNLGAMTVDAFVDLIREKSGRFE